MPEEVFELFCDVWSSWAGFPKYIHVDKGGAFEGFFAERMQALGVDMDAIPAEAHWQAGSVEAYNRAFRYAAEKLIDEKQLSGDLEMKILAASVSASMKTRKGKRVPGGWYRATVVGPHKGDQGQNNYWVTSGGRCILVAREQMRPAYGTELWRIREEDLREVLEQPPRDYVDERSEVALEETASLPGEVAPMYGDDPEEEAFDYDDGDPRGELPLRELPAEPHREPHGEPPREPHGEPRREPHGEPLGPLVVPSTQDVEGSSVPTDTTQLSPLAAQSRSSGPHREEPEPKRLRVEDGAGDDSIGGPVRQDDERIEDFLEALLTNRYVPASKEELASQPSQDFQAQVLVAGTQDRRQYPTRKEQKALEKEIPFSMIPEDQRPAYREALEKEWGTWKRYEAVAPLSLEASQAAEYEYPANRILDTRVCYRNKNAGYPWMPLKAKARLVCRGDRDPDLLQLRRDAPTLTRMSLMIILQLVASNAAWFLFNADITGAFLQGDQSMASRELPLFLRQPREGLPGLLPGQLLLVIRGIFGLANSPRLFWRHLRDTLKSLGFIQSTLDKALFFYYKAGHLVLLLGTHVDDLLGAGVLGLADEVLQRVKDAFDFGAWADSREGESLEYGGKQIKKEQDGTVTLSQSKFIQAITITPVPRWRAMMVTESLSATEATELRSGGGCLHWLIGQTRPDLAAATSLCMSGTPKVQNLVELNRILKEAKASQDWCMRFVPVDLERARIVTYTDASWANGPDLKSQAGYLTFITGDKVFSVEETQLHSWTGGHTESSASVVALWRPRRWQWTVASTVESL